MKILAVIVAGVLTVALAPIARADEDDFVSAVARGLHFRRRRPEDSIELGR